MNYGSAVAVVSALTWTSPALANGSDWSWGVRSVDTATGYVDSNIDATSRTILDASGNDVTARPNAPTLLTARPTAAGGCRANWAYNAAGQGGPPQGFRVWLTAGSTPNYAASPALTVGYFAGQARYKADMTGLADGASYVAAVRAYNATAAEPNVSAVAAVVGKASGPSDVDGLGVSVTTQAG